MRSLFFRNLFFAILQPGTVAGLMPWLLAREEWENVYSSSPVRWMAGLVVFLSGFAIMLACIVRFGTEGNGTLSPADPTKKLVTGGLYRYSRNPMYIGVTLMLIAESLLTGSIRLWLYSLVVFIAFNLFIFLHEEPRLIRAFGEEYLVYRKKVRRWV